MHALINKYKKYLKPTLGLILCVISATVLPDKSFAFLISGGGDNLRVIHTNQSKSSSFQINAKLKPTAIARDIVPIPDPPITPVVVPPTTPKITPPVIAKGDDGSSPYTGTANWDYQDRSKKATEARRLAKIQEEEDEKIHTSAPKEEIIKVENIRDNSEEKLPPILQEKITDNLATQIINTENAEDIFEETSSQISQEKNNFVVANESQVIINPAKFSLKFLEKDLISPNYDKKSCKNTAVYVFDNNDYWYIIAKTLFLIVVCLTGIFFCLAILVYLIWRKSREKNKKSAKKSFWQKFKNLLSVLILVAIMTGTNNVSAGPITTPQQLIYEGDLLDNAEVPLTGNYSFRFSLWNNEDFEAGDVIAGAINVGATDYYNWQEVQSKSLVDGKFSLRLGSVAPFFAGLFDHTNMYLQVEVKNSADPDTSYELIDLDVASSTIDRTVIDTIPFAFNADKLDFRDTGFNSGEIPYLDINSKLATSTIPNGVDENEFKLDADGNALPNDILTLKFGNILGKTLTWNGLAGQFEFNDKVRITGDLIVTGTINGVTLSSKNKTETLSPRYPNSIIEKDGTTNSGSMYEEVATISAKNKNVLKWNSNKTTLQDYDVIIRYPLPANFAGFQATPISLEFMTEGTFTDAKVDFAIEKEGSVLDELSGAGIGYNSNSWTTVNLNLNPATTWSPNDVMVIKLKMYSRNNLKSYVGDIGLKYIEN